MGVERTTVRGVELAHETTGQGQRVIWGHGLTSSRAAEDAAPFVNWDDVALVLVIPPTAWEVREAQADQWGAAAHVVTTKGVEPIIAARREVAPPDPYLDDLGFRARYETNLLSWDHGRLAQVFRGATSADLPPRDAVAAITCPTLILAWTGDPTHPESTAKQLNELIAGSELHLASAGEQLGQWTARVEAFLAAL